MLKILVEFIIASMISIENYLGGFQLLQIKKPYILLLIRKLVNYMLVQPLHSGVCYYKGGLTM